MSVPIKIPHLNASDIRIDHDLHLLGRKSAIRLRFTDKDGVKRDYALYFTPSIKKLSLQVPYHLQDNMSECHWYGELHISPNGETKHTPATGSSDLLADIKKLF